MGQRLAGKAAIITGAAQGIGAATAELFAAEGASVVVADVNEELGTARAESIRSAGGNAEFFRLDVTDFEQWKGCIAFTEERFGKLTILVNNAGISYSLTVAETTVEHWNRVIATNQTSVYYGMKLAIEAMARTGEQCAIANASSVDGLVGESRFFAYCAAKGAVTLMTKAAALHCAEQNLPIRINSVHPVMSSRRWRRSTLHRTVRQWRSTRGNSQPDTRWVTWARRRTSPPGTCISARTRRASSPARSSRSMGGSPRSDGAVRLPTRPAPHTRCW